MRNFLNRMETIITTLFDCKIVTINSYKIAQWLTTKKSAFLTCVGAARSRPGDLFWDKNEKFFK
jgi:hypothetical protein